LLAIGQEKPVDFVCPMDADVRAATPGRCPRCGMKLEAGLPEPREYPVQLQTRPSPLVPGRPADLVFGVLDPDRRQPVREFQIVHEKLFHLFVVSRDLQYFAHEHPELRADGRFHLSMQFPRAGQYRLLCDFYPAAGTPQLIAKTIFTKGAEPSVEPVRLSPDLAPQQGENTRAELQMEPPVPIAGKKTLLFLRLTPGEGIQPYLGAWAHMLAASDDLVDMLHLHPAIAEGGPQVQFNVIFPRPLTYRVWIQFQRAGLVNTVAFNIPVSELR
jgi:hypothetical protein